MTRFIPHPHIAARKLDKPVSAHERHARDTNRISAWLALKITAVVGTMACAGVFGLIAVISLPSAIKSGNLTILVAWVSSNFLQLVLLSILMVGQNIQGKANDARAEQTYNDAEAVLHTALQIEEHLQQQDAILTALSTERTP